MINNVQLLKSVDKIIGKFVVKLFPVESPRPIINKPILHKILFIRPGGIGDAVLLIPAMLTLKEHFPNCIIHVLAEKRNEAVFALSRSIDNVMLYDRYDGLCAVLHEKYDLVVDTEQWHRLSAVVSRLTGAPLRIGFATNERQKLYTNVAPYSHDDNEQESFLRLVCSSLGIAEIDVPLPFLQINDEIFLKTSTYVASLSGRHLVTVFPGASIEERRWEVKKFHEVARRLTDAGYGIAVVGGGGDVKSGEQISNGIAQAVNLCGKLTLAETAAVVKISSLLISGDSGILHLAYGLGVKTVSLFGSGIESKWAPRGERHRTINKHLSCSPCTRYGYTAKCAADAICMKQITVEDVCDSASQLVGRII